jgi:hypothetical protein
VLCGDAAGKFLDTLDLPASLVGVCRPSWDGPRRVRTAEAPSRDVSSSTFSTKRFRRASTRTIWSLTGSTWFFVRDSSSGCSWSRHVVFRRRHALQTASDEEANVHRTFLRLHSQQLRVPRRTFRRFGSGRGSGEAEALCRGSMAVIAGPPLTRWCCKWYNAVYGDTAQNHIDPMIKPWAEAWRSGSAGARRKVNNSFEFPYLFDRASVEQISRRL